MEPRSSAPAAQDELDDSGLLEQNGAAPAEQTPGAGDPSSPAAGDNNMRNRLARQGRELAAERRRADQATQAAREAASRTSVLEARLNELAATLTQRQQDELEAQLAELPPEQRAEWRVHALQQRVDQMEQERLDERTRVQQTQQARADAANLVAQANEYFGLQGGGLQITGQEPELDRTSRATYLASLRALGMSRQRYGGDARGEDTDMAAKKKTSVLDTLTPEQREAVRKEYESEQLRSTGAGRSFNPRPSGGVDEVTEDDYIALSMKHSPKNPAATREGLSRLAERGT